MTTANVTKFVETLIVHFPRRETSEGDDIAWMKSMNRNLQNFPREVLEKAAEIIIDGSGFRQFHWLPKECKEACFEAQRLLEIAKPKPLPLDKKFPEHAESRIYEADMLICAGQLGKRAAKEGWILSLHDFARTNLRLPQTEGEIRNCIQAAKGFDDAYADCLRAPSDSLQARLIALGDSMLAKREKLRAMVLEGKR